jgi:hypothetical protein
MSRRRSLNTSEVKELNEAKEQAKGSATPLVASKDDKHAHHSASTGNLHQSSSGQHKEEAVASDVTIEVTPSADKNLKFKSKRDRGSSSGMMDD